MEETHKISLLEGTGYERWMDLYFHQNSYTEQRGIFLYYYTKPNGERSQIDLPFPYKILQLLAFEESKQLLAEIQEKSFSALLESKKNVENGSFIFQIVIIEEDGSISYQKLSISFDYMYKLSELEKLDFTHIVQDKRKAGF